VKYVLQKTLSLRG